MTKQQFTKIMEELISIKNDESKLNDAFKKFEPNFSYISFGRYESLIVETLEIAMNDTAEWISYFLYERKCKFTNEKIIKNKNGKNVPLRNYNDLYNLIKNNK